MFNVNFKDGLDLNDLNKMDEKIIYIFFTFINYCRERDLECTITSLMEDVPGRKSTTHKTGRAFDARANTWDKRDAKALVEYFNTNYVKLGTAPKGRQPKVVVDHGEGANYHFHFQVRWG